MKRLNTRQYILITTILLLTISIGAVFLLREKHSEEYREAVTIRDITFQTQLATTDSEKVEGLMNVTSMPEGKGMLFVYDHESPKRFWMKDTIIPLDMIFIDDVYRIVEIFENVPPCDTEECSIYYTPKGIKYVLEINGGLSKTYGFKIGDLVEFTNESL